MSNKRSMALHWKILIGLVLGVVVGLAINTMWDTSTWNSMGVDDPTAWVKGHESEAVNQSPSFTAHAALFIRNLNSFIGDLFMRGLRFIAVPIVVFSLIVGASSLNDLSKLSRIGGKTIGIYVFTTAIAITVGLLFANVVKPGNFVSEETRDGFVAQFKDQADSKVAAAQAPDVWDTVLNIIPKNPFEAIAAGNMLQVVFASLLVGIALTMIKREKAVVVIRFFDAMTDVIIKVVEIVLMIAPYAVFALIVEQIAELGLDILGSLAVYSLVVVAGLATMMFVIYPIGFKVLGKVPMGRFYRAISPAQLLAFSSASSSATLPVTMECCEQRLGIKEEVSSFVLPIGATINMDGTALYQGVAAVFIAQLYQMDLSIAEQLTIVLTATLASIGTAGVPGVGMIMLVIVLQSVNIPLEGIAVILGVDRILDMCRTSCNVTGDCMVCALVASSEDAIGDPSESRSTAESGSWEGRPIDEDPPEAGRIDL
ncbi:MAG: dicarboxylate/amino acid:cation symporter [Phycisphaerales bacterium]